jgi:carboxylesterase type B
MGKPIMAVSFNYRLHFLGWPYSQDALNAGVTNLGLRDQRFGLTICVISNLTDTLFKD